MTLDEAIDWVRASVNTTADSHCDQAWTMILLALKKAPREFNLHFEGGSCSVELASPQAIIGVREVIRVREVTS